MTLQVLLFLFLFLLFFMLISHLLFVSKLLLLKLFLLSIQRRSASRLQRQPHANAASSYSIYIRQRFVLTDITIRCTAAFRPNRHRSPLLPPLLLALSLIRSARILLTYNSFSSHFPFSLMSSARFPSLLSHETMNPSHILLS